MGSVTLHVARQLDIPVHISGALSLVAANDVPRFLDGCKLVRARVLGIEGFRLHGGGVRPDMDAIADLSRVVEPGASVEEARVFTSQFAGSDLLFEFTLEAHADEGG